MSNGDERKIRKVSVLVSRCLIIGIFSALGLAAYWFIFLNYEAAEISNRNQENAADVAQIQSPSPLDEEIRNKVNDSTYEYESSSALKESGECLSENNTEAIAQELERCMLTNQDTQGTIACINQASRQWDGEIQRIYGDLRNILVDKETAALIEVQESWIDYKQKEQSFRSEVYNTVYSGLDGGTMWLIAGAEAEMKVPRQRALDLNYYANEVRQGSLHYPDFYPDNETEEHRTVALTVKNNYMAIGKTIANESKAVAAYQAYCSYIDKEVEFMAVLYGKENDSGFRLHNHMVFNNEQLTALERILEDLEHCSMPICD